MKNDHDYNELGYQDKNPKQMAKFIYNLFVKRLGSIGPVF